METLHSLNDMYGTTNEHQLKVKTNKCYDCSKASFIITIRDLSDREQIMKFHRGKWLAASNGNFYCEKCRKGKQVI